MITIRALDRIFASCALRFASAALVLLSAADGRERGNGKESDALAIPPSAAAAKVPQSPTWAEGLVLFGMVAIDGAETAYFGTRDRMTILSLCVGEELANGIRLIALRNAEFNGQMEAELGRNGETAIVRCATETDGSPDLILIAEPAPTTQSSPIPAAMPLPSKPVTESGVEVGESKAPESSPRSGEDRPAVVPWPRQVRG